MEFDLQVQLALDSPEITNLISQLTAKANNCRQTCIDTQAPLGCVTRCEQPLGLWEDFISEKRLIYVKRGAVFCKQSCWEIPELRPCLKKCFADYSKLFTEFHSVVKAKLQDLLTID